MKKRFSYYKTDADWGPLEDFEQEDSLLVRQGEQGARGQAEGGRKLGGPGRRGPQRR